MLFERISLERQTLWRISFRVYDLRKFKDGGAHGRTEAERYRSLSERTGVDIASAEIISDLVNDYFIIRPIGDDESNSDLCEFVEDFATSCVLIFNVHFC